MNVKYLKDCIKLASEEVSRIKPDDTAEDRARRFVVLLSGFVTAQDKTLGDQIFSVLGHDRQKAPK